MPVPAGAAAAATTLVVGTTAERDMRLVIHGKRTVVPSWPSEPVILPVTSLDAALANFYLHNVYYFDRLGGDRKEQQEELHLSLGRVLNAFPVMAGRLRVVADGSLGIKLNDAGIRMFEASVDGNLREWLDRAASPDSPTLSLYPPEIHISDYSISPLVAVQCTQFRCGGVAIGLSWSHVLGDLSSMAVFVRLWGEAHGGATSFSIEPSFKLEQSSKNGVNHDHSVLVVHGEQQQQPPQKLDSRVLQLGPKAVESMMAAAPGLSEAEAVCAHIWAGVATTETSGSRKHFLWRDDSSTRPANYFGNGALAFQLAEATRDESCASALGRGDSSSDSDAGDSGDVVFCAWATGARCYDVDFAGFKPFLVEALLQSSAVGLGGAAVAVLPGAEGGRSKAVGLSLRPEAMRRLLRDDNISASCRSLQQQQQQQPRRPMPVAGAPAA